MSAIINISYDGHVEAIHNSGEELWTLEIDPTGLPHEYPVDGHITEDIADFLTFLPDIHGGLVELTRSEIDGDRDA